MGAAGVALVGHHNFRLKLASQLGTDLSVNSKLEDPVTCILDWTGGEGCDVVIEAAGGAVALQQALGMVSPGGRLVMFGLPDPSVPIDMTKVVLDELDVIGALGHPNRWKSTIDLMGRRELEVDSLLTHLFPVDDAFKAFAVAESRADDCVKVQLEMP